MSRALFVCEALERDGDDVVSKLLADRMAFALTSDGDVIGSDDWGNPDNMILNIFEYKLLGEVKYSARL